MIKQYTKWWNIWRCVREYVSTFNLTSLKKHQKHYMMKYEVGCFVNVFSALWKSGGWLFRNQLALFYPGHIWRFEKMDCEQSATDKKSLIDFRMKITVMVFCHLASTLQIDSELLRNCFPVVLFNLLVIGFLFEYVMYYLRCLRGCHTLVIPESPHIYFGVKILNTMIMGLMHPVIFYYTHRWYPQSSAEIFNRFCGYAGI